MTRREFHPLLLDHMRRDPRIWLLTSDLGMGMFDAIMAEFPDRAINPGAAEQLCLGAAVGLADEGKIPIVYCITPFVLWRAAEWIRNYLNHDLSPVKLLGGGRGEDYARENGFSHYAGDDKALLGLFPNVVSFWPDADADKQDVVNLWLYNGKPSYLNLKR